MPLDSIPPVEVPAAMDYHRALDYLLSFTDFERTGGFTRRDDVAPMRSLLRHLDSPERGRLTVHIAGSKGKGSTAAMIASILREGDLTVGLYTSPHLHHICERIQVNGRQISNDDFVRLASAIPPAIQAVQRELPERKLVTFDLLTAMAFLAFAESGADVQVLETGLGGRVDSTNAVDNKQVCVITSISLEHQAILGETVPEIAVEKAGIIFPGTKVILARQEDGANDVVRRTCQQRGAELIEAENVCRFERRCRGIEGQEILLSTRERRYELWLPLLGLHQVENAVAAVLAVEALQASGIEVSEQQVRDGLAKVEWPGRLEVLGRRPLLLADGAHNAESTRRLCQTLRDDLGFSRATFVIGVSRDKDTTGMEHELRPLAARLIATSSRHPRAMEAEQVAAAFSLDGVSATPVAQVSEAIDSAVQLGRPDELVCVLGSLFVAAEARAHVLGIEHEFIG
jgi:dihydrofolate synthase/folylpolyglutamate synthase